MPLATRERTVPGGYPANNVYMKRCFRLCELGFRRFTLANLNQGGVNNHNPKAESVNITVNTQGVKRDFSACKF